MSKRKVDSVLVYNDETRGQEARKPWEYIAPGSLVSCDDGKTWEILLSEVPHPALERIFKSCYACLYMTLLSPEMMPGTPSARLYHFSAKNSLVPIIEEWAESLISRGGVPQQFTPAAFLPAGLYCLRTPDPGTWRWISPVEDQGEHGLVGNIHETESRGRDVWRPGDVAMHLTPWVKEGSKVGRQYCVGVVANTLVRNAPDDSDSNFILVGIAPFPFSTPEVAEEIRWPRLKEELVKFLALPPEKRVELVEP